MGNDLKHCPHGCLDPCTPGCVELRRRAQHYSDALTWLERNTPDGIRLVARALAETTKVSAKDVPRG